MVIYSCELCNFKSNLFGNYKQHLKTKKHLNRTAKNTSLITKNEHKMNTNEHKRTQMNTNEHKNNESIFSCQYCQKTFNSRPIKDVMNQNAVVNPKKSH